MISASSSAVSGSPSPSIVMVFVTTSAGVEVWRTTWVVLVVWETGVVSILSLLVTTTGSPRVTKNWTKCWGLPGLSDVEILRRGATCKCPTIILAQNVLCMLRAKLKRNSLVARDKLQPQWASLTRAGLNN
jgi:hypothetical protein